MCEAGKKGHRRMVLSVVCALSIVLTVVAYKKPTFCEQDGDPFSFLWTIRRDPPSYLFGTIHVPYTRVWEHVPDNAKRAFSACSRVYFELDLVDPTTVSALSTCQMLPQGKNLSDVLPGDLYVRLKRHLEYVRGMMPRWMTADQRGRGLYADYLFNAIAGNWERKRPVWVMLMVNSLTESEVRSRGVPVLDLYLAQEAERLRKQTAAVERVEEQCLPLNGLNLSQVLFALNHTLLQHEEQRDADLQQQQNQQQQGPYTTDDLIRHYNCGDLNAVVFGQDAAPVPSLANSSLSDEDAVLARDVDLYFRQELIHNRNMRMGARVAQLVRENPDQSLFFAFGAGHFLGNNTVLDFVQSHGFEVEHLSVNTKIPKSKTKKSVRNDTPPKSGPRTLVSQGQDSSVPARRGQNRRSNRHRSATPFQRTGSSPGSKKGPEGTPVPAVTTQRPRRFNDLWVRLDTYGKKKSTPPGVNSVEDPHAPKQAFRSWFQKNQEPQTVYSSSSADVFRHPQCSLTVIFVCVTKLLARWPHIFTGIT